LSQTKTGDVFKEIGKGVCFGGEKVAVDILTCSKNKNLYVATVFYHQITVLNLSSQKNGTGIWPCPWPHF
jgi:predicted helicase